MTTLTIDLPTEQFEKLEQLAGRYRIAPEELVRLSIEDLLTRVDVVHLNELIRRTRFNELAFRSQSAFDAYVRKHGINPDGMDEAVIERLLADE